MPRIGNKNALRHGGVGTSTHHVWMGMKARCDNPNNKDYRNYGGRGITYAPAWSDFAAFRKDMGERPEGMSLDRIDNEKGYSSDNCRWATMTEQRRNTRTNRQLTAFGRVQPLASWAEEYNLRRDTLARRLERGWSVEDALKTPLRCRPPLPQDDA